MGWTLSPRSWAAARHVILGGPRDLEKPKGWSLLKRCLYVRLAAALPKVHGHRGLALVKDRVERASQQV